MFHFMNCVLLAYAPYVVLYRSTKLKEESALRSCIAAGVGYAATQAVKIFIMATMLPAFGEGQFSAPQEVLRTLVQAIDIFGLQFTLQFAPNLSKFDSKTRILAVSTGWAFAESLFSYLIPLWIGARGMEFGWEYIGMGLDANINLLRVLALVSVLWLRLRTDLDKAFVPVVFGVIAAYVTQPSLVSFFESTGVSSWNLLLLRGAIGAATAVVANGVVNQYLKSKQ